MWEAIVQKEVLKVYIVCATAVQSQLFSFADLFSNINRSCYGQFRPVINTVEVILQLFCDGYTLTKLVNQLEFN